MLLPESSHTSTDEMIHFLLETILFEVVYQSAVFRISIVEELLLIL